MTESHPNRLSVIQKHRGPWAEMIACSWLLQQGYEVFRNVSMHGLIDVVGVKDGEVFKFDVKGIPAVWNTFPMLTQEQVAMGVKILAVYDDAKVVICDDPSTHRPQHRACVKCGKTYQPRQKSQIFCTKSCQTAKIPVMVACATCKQEFSQKSTAHIFCCRRCFDAARAERLKARRDGTEYRLFPGPGISVKNISPDEAPVPAPSETVARHG